MTEREIVAAAEAVVRAHIDAINRGDTAVLRTQLIGSEREKPFGVYSDAMLRLRPLEIRALRTDEPQPTQRPPGPRVRVRVYVQLASGEHVSDEELPVWVFPDIGEAKIASRIMMRRATAVKT